MRITAVLAAVLALAACNTIEGIGRDVKSGGEAISEGARKAKDAISQ